MQQLKRTKSARSPLGSPSLGQSKPAGLLDDLRERQDVLLPTGQTLRPDHVRDSRDAHAKATRQLNADGPLRQCVETALETGGCEREVELTGGADEVPGRRPSERRSVMVEGQATGRPGGATRAPSSRTAADRRPRLSRPVRGVTSTSRVGVVRRMPCASTAQAPMTM